MVADALAATQRRQRWGGAIHVTPERALESDAVWAAQTLIASLGSSIPLDEIQTTGESRTKVPLARFLTDPDPDPSIDAEVFRYQILQSLASRGNAYAMVLGQPGGPPEGLVSIHPTSVRWEFQEGRWKCFVDGVEHKRYPLGSLWHVGINVQSGSPIGMDPINYHSGTLAPALAARTFGSKFFDAGGLPVGFVYNDGTDDPGPDGAKRIKQRIVEALNGSRDPIVMPSGMRFEATQVNAEESQFLETQRYGVEQAARVYFGGFPEMIGGSVSGGGSQTYANLEQRVNTFATLALIPRYLAPLESALSRLLPDGFKARHNVNALSRSDLAARYESYLKSAQVQQLTGMPILSNDEIRALEDRPPLDPGNYATPIPEGAQ
jgi:HK97 family phage portal protein